MQKESDLCLALLILVLKFSFFRIIFKNPTNSEVRKETLNRIKVLSISVFSGIPNLIFTFPVVINCRLCQDTATFSHDCSIEILELPLNWLAVQVPEAV